MKHLLEGFSVAVALITGIVVIHWVYGQAMIAIGPDNTLGILVGVTLVWGFIDWLKS